MTQLTTAELKELNDEARPYGGPFLCTTCGTALQATATAYYCPKHNWSWTHDGDVINKETTP